MVYFSNDFKDLISKGFNLILVISLISPFKSVSAEGEKKTLRLAVELQRTTLSKAHIMHYPPFNNTKNTIEVRNSKHLMRQLLSYEKQFNDTIHKECATGTLSYSVDDMRRTAKAYKRAATTLIADLESLMKPWKLPKVQQKPKRKQRSKLRRKEPCSHVIENAYYLFTDFDTFLNNLLLSRNLNKIFPPSKKKILKIKNKAATMKPVHQRRKKTRHQDETNFI